MRICLLDKYGNRHTQITRNIYCSSTTTMVMRTLLMLHSYVHCLSILIHNHGVRRGSATNKVSVPCL